MNRIKQFLYKNQQADSQEKGQSIVLIALMMVAILAFVGIAIDVGFIFARGSQLQSAIDSAALAGVTELTGWTEGGANNATLEGNALTKSAQFLNANNMPISVTNSINLANNINVSETPLGATEYAVTATWPVETYFLKVIGFRAPINLTRSATAAIFSLADIYVSRRVEDGVLSTSNQAIFGYDSCSHMGDPYSPNPANGGQGPYTYTYRIYIPPSYNHDVVRVELFDPDSINTSQNSTTILRTNLAVNEGLGATASRSCGGSRVDPCLLATDELGLVSADIELDQINPYWFVRIDENRRPPNTLGGSCGAPGSYTASMNTQTQYSLYYFAQNASGTIARVPLVTYIGQTGDGTRDNGNHLTDMRWVSPGAANPFSPVDSPGVTVPAISETVNSFEIDLTSDVPGIVTDPSDGTRFIFLDVIALAGSGSSENGFEIWAGPPIYTDGDPDVPDVPSEVNARNLYALNNPGSHSSEGVTVYGLGNLPMNSNFSNEVDVPLIYVGPDMIGQTINVSMFDSDSGASPPVIFYFDSIAFTPDDGSNLGYDPDATDWALAFHVSGQTDPDGVTRPCTPGSCNNQWVNYNIVVPGNLDNCDYDNPTMAECTPFFGGRLIARYGAGFTDTYGWQISVEGLPYLVK